MKSTQLSIAVVICTRNRPQLIGACLDAVLACQPQPAEVLVVDQSDDEQTAQVIAARSSELVQVVSSAPLGLSAARNLGIQHTSAPLIAFTDDDCIVDANWLSATAAEFEAEPSLMGLFGRVLPYTEGEALGRERPIGVKESTHREVFTWPTNPWRLGHGANMVYRRAVFEQVGQFDVLLSPGGALHNCDDADMSYRVLRSGGTIAYAPSALVYHRQWRLGKAIWRLERTYNLGAGGLYSKHLRYGDRFMFRLMYDRLWTVGLEHIFLGLWQHNSGRIKLGVYRVVYTLLGMVLGLKYRLEQPHRRYQAAQSSIVQHVVYPERPEATKI
jgi:GT2 family glycosyltransferase